MPVSRTLTSLALVLVLTGCNATLGDPLEGAHTSSDELRRGVGAPGADADFGLAGHTRADLEELEGEPTGEEPDTVWAVFDCPSGLRVATHPSDGAEGWAASAAVDYDVNEAFTVYRSAEHTSQLFCAHRRGDGILVAEVARTIAHTAGCTAIPAANAFACRVFFAPVACELPLPNEFGGYRGFVGWDHEGAPFSFYGSEGGFVEGAIPREPGADYCDARFHVVIAHDRRRAEDIAQADRVEPEITAPFAIRGVRVITELYAASSAAEAAAWRDAHGQSTPVIHYHAASAPPGPYAHTIVDHTGRIRWRGWHFEVLVPTLEALLNE